MSHDPPFTPTSRPSRPPWPASASSDPWAIIMDMRERLAVVETDHQNAMSWAQDRARSAADRMSGIDARLAKGDGRMNRLDRQVQALEHVSKQLTTLPTELSALRDRISGYEVRRAAAIAWLQYGAAALILGLTATGRLDAEKGVSALMKLIGGG